MLRHKLLGQALIMTVIGSGSAIQADNATPAAAAQNQAVQPAKIATAPLRKAVELTERNGLPNFFAKLKPGASIKIAYLGGSITAQQGWRIYSLDWFKKQYPQVKFEEINAAIGGTPSELGVFRLKRDVLDHKPDLLLVEFATNDQGTPPDGIVKAMEGIVRQTWKNFPECDIAFVYTVVEKDIKELQNGQAKRSVTTMEAVADFYQIPSIHFGVEVAKMEKAGELTIKEPQGKVEQVAGGELDKKAKSNGDTKQKMVFSKDGVHPYPNTGHLIYQKTFARSMEQLAKIGKPGAHQPAAPLDPANWELATCLPLDQGNLDGQWQKLPAKEKEGLQKRMPGLWLLKNGATVSFKFKGTKVGFYDLLGPDCGNVELIVDNKSTIVKRIDGYCTYHRLGNFSSQTLENKEHEVVVRALPEPPDKRKILFPTNLPDMDKNPAKYQGANWYVGAIFVLGELVKADAPAPQAPAPAPAPVKR